MLRLLGYLFTAGCILFIAGAVAAGYLISETTKTLPEHSQLASYEPPVLTRIHAGDGSLLAEYAEERRLFVPIHAVPQQLVNAFLSAEDKRFYSHSGVDYEGIIRAIARYGIAKAQGQPARLTGASTITQQVAKNFLLTNERTWQRKLREALVAQRIEATLSKDQIMELYLNEIFLGLGTYGVAAASLTYFGKSLSELSLPEMAYLAALPKGPNNYHPHRRQQEAIERRNWVLERMEANGFIDSAEKISASKARLEVKLRPFGAQLFAAENFTEEVRRQVQRLYGTEKLYAGGLSVRTTLDPKLQIFARQALTAGLMKFDRKQGWRGAVKKIDLSTDWGQQLADTKVLADIRPWQLAVVLQVNESEAKIGLRPGKLADGSLVKERYGGAIPLEFMKWAREARDRGSLGPEVESVDQVLAPGDAVYVAPSKERGKFHLVQLPKIEGALVALDPHTGRVLAMVGGFSYSRSQFNRAVQASRQPGSSIKPFVYAAALDNGYTPASVVMDAPIEIALPSGEIWKPKNYTDKFYGPSTLRLGIEKSRNAMTVRLAHDMGIDKFKYLVEKLGIYNDLSPVLAMSLGAGETTLLKMTTAYSMLANGGKQIEASLIDRIQDRYGRTVWRHDKRSCEGCAVEQWSEDRQEPEFPDLRDEVISPYTAYQVTSMMEGVVQRGTGTVLKDVGRPLAGKTGTTNEERDAWFIGYSPDLAVGVFVGYDNPQPMGKGSTGGGLAAPVVRDFFKLALRDKPATPFRVPAGIELIPIDPTSGLRAAYGDDNVILEAFKPGEQPSIDAVVIGGAVGEGASGAAVVEGGLTTGTGGLY